MTPYSRQADGRAVLRSSIREFLCSEAMWSLGIPTTRAASLVLSESTVDRDKLYNGNVIAERCAVVTRVAPTFIRFGSFQIFLDMDGMSGRAGPSNGLRNAMAPKMLNYLHKYFFPEIPDDDKKYELMFERIVLDTAETAALWQAYGFCHGVLNTDNMSILGLTIDYGPFGWMEHFDPDHICNNSDMERGRYRYKAQPEICEWNLQRLADALHPILDKGVSHDLIKNLYKTTQERHYRVKMAQRLGILLTRAPEGGPIDLGSRLLRVDPTQEFRELLDAEKEVIEELYTAMAETGADFNDTFRVLARANPSTVDETVASLVKLSAPQKLADKKGSQSRYSPAQLAKLAMLLE